MRRSRFIAVSRGRALSVPSGAADPIGDALRTDAQFFYKLESDGSDSTPNARHLENATGVSFGAGKLGNAGIFTAGTTSYLATANAYPSPGSSDFSISMWWKRTGTPTASSQVFGKYSGGANPSFRISYKSTGNTFTIRDAGGATTVTPSGGTMQDGLWHHYIVNADRDGNADVYLDGVVFGSASIASRSGSLDSADIYNICGQGTITGSGGTIDSVGVWFRLLTADEIAYLHNSGNGRSLY